MRAIHLPCAATCLLFAVAAHNSSAQEQIPKELALALIPNGATEGGEIMVGKLPPDLAASITRPPGGRILGSFMSVAYGQSVIALPFEADSARAFVRHALTEHGWGRTMPLSSVPPLWSPGDPLSSMGACQPAGPGNALSYQSQQPPLRTDLSPEQILAYYGKQLDSAGWKPGEPPNESATRTWTKAAGTDSAQDVTLAVAKTTAPGCYRIDLRATARGPRR